MGLLEGRTFRQAGVRSPIADSALGEEVSGLFTLAKRPGTGNAMTPATKLCLIKPGIEYRLQPLPSMNPKARILWRRSG